MDFGEILTKAWKTVWKHKILWLFGVLAGCGATHSAGGGGGGGGNAVYSGGEAGSWGGPTFLSPSAQQFFSDFAQFLAEIPVWAWIITAFGVVFTLIIISFVMSLVFLLAGTLGTSGVIKGTSLADQADPEAKPLSLSTIFKAIKPYFWKVFLFNLAFRVVGFLVGMIFIVPLILLMVCTCFLGLFLLVPIGWFIDLMVNFTTIAIIEEEKGILDAIKRAWQVIIHKLGHVVLMFLILGIGQMIVSLIIALPILIVPVPILINLFASDFSGVGVGLIISLLFLLAIIPIVVFLSGVLKAYVLSSWTLFYRRLTGEESQDPVVLSSGLEETPQEQG